MPALLAAAVCFLLPAPAMRADIQNPPRAHAPGERAVQRKGEGPAMAVAGAAEVEEGGRVEITLRAHGPAGKGVTFLLRRPPAHGTLLGEPRQLTPRSAVVTYAHQPGDGSAADEFTVAVQAAGGAVSAPEKVAVAIRQAPASVAASPAELDFGAVTAGEASRAEVTLENRGGAEAAGRVEPPPPWAVEGAAEYRLPRGASQTFRLVFRPPGEQAFTESLHLRGEPPGSAGVRLVGAGLASPAQLAAAAERRAAASRAREAEAAALAPQTAAASPPPAPARPAAADPGAAGVVPVAAFDSGGSGPQRAAAPGEVDATRVSLNEARVTGFEITRRGTTTLDLAWKPPSPRPKSYRVELRYLPLDPDDGKLRVDWRPYALVDVRAANAQVTAHVHGLPAGTRQTVRIVAVDAAGELAAPSAPGWAETLPPSTWWRPTPLKVLLALLALCGGLAGYRRWENQQILREIDESRRVRDKVAGVAR